MAEIQDTRGFRAALADGRLKEAMAWFEYAKLKLKYDDRWRAGCSRELLDALCDAGQFDDAEKYVNYSTSAEGRQRRRDKIVARRKASS